MNIKITVIACVGLVFASSSYAKLRIGGVEVTNSNGHYLTYTRHMAVPFASQNGATWDSGNNVQGKTAAEIQAIVTATKLLETNARQKEIPVRMAGTPIEWFTFTSLDHAKNTVKQRLETVQMMDIFNSPNSRYRYGTPHTGVPYSTTAGHWEKGSRATFFFRQKSGTAYEAITQMCDGSSVTKGECLGAITACVWWGASRALGLAEFNQLYPGTKALNMDFGLSNSWGWNVRAAIDAAENHHVVGDWMYLKNHNYTQVINVKEFYKKGWLLPATKKTYYWSGENSLYFGSGIYEGLGVENKTSAAMREKLRTKYNGDLAQVITNGGKINGVLVETITPQNAINKIIWTNIRRLKH